MQGIVHLKQGVVCFNTLHSIGLHMILMGISAPLGCYHPAVQVLLVKATS